MFKLQHRYKYIKVGMINEIRDFFERRGYEVCSRLGDRMGVRPDVVRLYFIYTSFLAFGSPVIVYLFLAFWIRIKDYLKSPRRSLLDL